jgi:dipeptidyl-peptidase-4
VSSDVGGVFVDTKTNNKRFYLKNSDVGLDPDNIPFILNGKGQKNLLPLGGHQNAEFSNTFSFFILQQSKANEPVSFALYNNKGEQLRMLESNQALKDKLKEYR